MTGIDLLVTVDLEIAHDRGIDAQCAAIHSLADGLRDAPTSWFTTATAAQAFADTVGALARSGHAIGCHGLDHGHWEDYRRLDRRQIGTTLGEATRTIAEVAQRAPRLFRGPRMTTSAQTQDVLEDLGYIADFSPCARRLDCFAASGYEMRWARVANRPYRPSATDPFRQGARKLIAVPLSGLAVPFVSGALYVLGLTAMQALARALVRRARVRRAPLVYLLHSYEFVPIDSRQVDHRPWHQRLYPADPARRLALNLTFIRWLIGDLGLRPVCGETFVDAWREARPC